MQGIVLLEHNRLASITNKAIIKVYDLKKGKCIATWGQEKKSGSSYELHLVNKRVVAMVDKEKKEYQLLRLGQSDGNLSLESYFKYRVRVKRVLNCVIEGEYIAICQQSGVFYSGQVDFHKEIEIYGRND